MCSTITRFWRKLAFAATALGLAFAANGCGSLLYYPTLIEHYPAELNSEQPERVWFKSSDGTWLNGWYLHAHAPSADELAVETDPVGNPANVAIKPKAVIAFFHGNGENLTSYYLQVKWLLHAGYDAFIFDYRGYGISHGSPSPEGTTQDGIAALRWVHAHHGDLPIVIFAQSLGGAIAAKTALVLKSEVPIKLMVLESTFVSYRAAASHLLAHRWLTWPIQPFAWVLLSDAWAPGDEIAQLSPTPIIVVHHPKDPVIDYSLGQALFAKAREPKEFWIAQSQPGHTNSFWQADPNELRERLLERLKKLGI